MLWCASALRYMTLSWVNGMTATSYTSSEGCASAGWSGRSRAPKPTVQDAAACTYEDVGVTLSPVLQWHLLKKWPHRPSKRVCNAVYWVMKSVPAFPQLVMVCTTPHVGNGKMYWRRHSKYLAVGWERCLSGQEQKGVRLVRLADPFLRLQYETSY